MSVKLQIYDGMTPMLDKIAMIHYGMGLDVLDQAGQKMRKSIRTALERSPRHRWQQKIVNGKRVIFRGQGKRPRGMMFSHTRGGIHQPGHIKHYITSYLMERSMTVVVGGKHPRFRAKTRRNGKVTGYQKAVQAVGDTAYGILQKIDAGGTYDEQSSDYKKARPSTIKSFKNARYRRTNFVAKGRNAAMSGVRDLMTNKLEQLIGRQVNRETVKMRRVA